MAGRQNPQGGLREMTRRAIQAEIARTATDLFLERGYDEVTIDQIAAAVGTSVRSVFRYFPTKEDMVLGDMLEQGRDLAAALAARPADEGPWEALRQAFDTCLMSKPADIDRALARATMLAATPSLRAACLHKRDQWIDLLYPPVLPRVDGPPSSRELRARAIVSAAVACLNTATDAWVQSAGKKALGAMLELAFEAVTSGPEAHVGSTFSLAK